MYVCVYMCVLYTQIHININTLLNSQFINALYEALIFENYMYHNA